MKKNKIAFGPEYGFNPPELGIEEMFFLPNSADVSLRGKFVIKYRHIKENRVTTVRVSPEDLVASGVLNLDKLKEFLK